MTTRTQTHRRRMRRKARRGMALYMAVLGTALIVSLLGLAGLTVLRIERRQATQSFDLFEARALAKAAVGLGLNRVNNDTNWRTTYTNGVETTPQLVSSSGTGTVSWVLEDSDGNLTDADTDLRLRGVGRVSDTVQVSSVKIQEQLSDADYLRCPIHCGGTLFLKKTADAVGGPFSSNVAIDGTNSPDTFTGDAEAPTYLGDQGKLTGTFTVTAAKAMPSDAVFDDIYKPLSSEIPYTNLPQQGSFRTMSGVLTPTVNNWGPTNANGIYYVHIPADGKVKLKNFTLNGTLLFEVDAGGKLSSSTLDAMSPASANYAVMIVKANGVDVDFDLAGSNGAVCSGLIHFVGDPSSTFTIGSHFNFTGTIVTNGSAIVGANNFGPILTHDPALEATPPLGYATGGSGVEAVGGSWLWDAAP